MNLKFLIQHDQTPRLQSSKIKSGREFKMAAVSENSKTLTFHTHLTSLTHSFEYLNQL